MISTDTLAKRLKCNAPNSNNLTVSNAMMKPVFGSKKLRQELTQFCKPKPQRH